MCFEHPCITFKYDLIMFQKVFMCLTNEICFTSFMVSILLTENFMVFYAKKIM